MEVIISVHGVVQGVGYRAFVKGVALKHGINGSVRNVPDGSVEIVASGAPDALALFERDIDVDTGHGPSVMRIEKTLKNEDSGGYTDFKAEEDRAP